ncbi:MAG: PAS domain-containing sensor histidine kinase, partial [Planctomycetaceae bacterium]
DSESGIQAVETLEQEDGVVHHSLVSKFPIPAADGRPAMVGGMAIDITGRKRAEERLRESEERYRILTEVSPQVVWTCDPDGNCTYCNQVFLDFTGRPRDELLGDRWTALVQPEHRARVRDAWFDAVHSGERYEVEIPFRRGCDGEYRWFLVRGLPNRDETGRIVRWSGTAMDITDRKQAEENLRKSEDRARRHLAELQTIYASAPIGLGFVNREFRYVSINQALAELDGLSVEQIVGRTLREVLTPEVADRVEPLYRRVIETGEPIDGMEVHGSTHAPGGPRDFLVSYHPVKAADGGILGVNAAVQDITERKRAEEDLRDADRRKDEFLATLAHELRNPLAPIRSGLELLGLAGDDRELLEEVRGTMEGQVRQMVRLIDDLLDVSRITRGKLELRRGRVELAAVVQSALESIRPLIDEAGHKLSVSLPEEPVMLHADAARLSQVLANLLGNAAKYTPHGGRIELTATCGVRSAECGTRNEEDCSSTQHSARSTQHFDH